MVKVISMDLALNRRQTLRLGTAQAVFLGLISESQFTAGAVGTVVAALTLPFVPRIGLGGFTFLNWAILVVFLGVLPFVRFVVGAAAIRTAIRSLGAFGMGMQTRLRVPAFGVIPVATLVVLVALSYAVAIHVFERRDF